MPGTITLANLKNSGWVRRLKLACTADAADGSFPSTDLLTLITSQTSGSQLEGAIHAVQADVGSPAPSEGWSLALTRAGADMLDGQCGSMPATDHFVPLDRPVLLAGDNVAAAYDTVSISIAGNSVNSAVIDLYFWLVPRPN